MAITPNLGLPLIDGSMTADVPRDMNALANAVDTALGNVSIPDASLTVKGKTQLSSATTSTQEDRAATPKAVNDARAAAVADSKIYADNGFIKKATLIPNGADLNAYTTEGGYYCPTNTGAATLINSPASYAFTLRVERHAGILQTLTTYQTSNFATYQRNYVAGGSPSPWGAWYKLPTSAEVLLAETNAKTYADVAIEQADLWGAL